MSRQAKELLERYRSAESLGSDARARMLTGLRAKIATGAPAVAASKGALSKLWAAGKAKIVLGVLAVGVPAAWTIHRAQSSVDYTLRTATPAVPVAPAVTAQPEPARAPLALTGEPYESATPALEGAPKPAPAAAEALTDERPAPKRSVTSERGSSPTTNSPSPGANGPAAAKVVLEESDEASSAEAPPMSTLDREMRLLKRAQIAQSAGRPSEALSILAEHAKQFPNGKLAESREVARVIALCQAGQTQASRAAAERFLAARPNSPFASRVRGVCTGK
jgi:hypothetical protein